MQRERFDYRNALTATCIGLTGLLSASMLVGGVSLLIRSRIDDASLYFVILLLGLGVIFGCLSTGFILRYLNSYIEIDTMGNIVKSDLFARVSIIDRSELPISSASWDGVTRGFRTYLLKANKLTFKFDDDLVGINEFVLYLRDQRCTLDSYLEKKYAP